jgi:hypothetical protein
MYLLRNGLIQMCLSKHQSIKKESTVSIIDLICIDTQYFYNTALENRLFYIRKGRRDPKLTEIIDDMVVMAK